MLSHGWTVSDSDDENSSTVVRLIPDSPVNGGSGFANVTFIVLFIYLFIYLFNNPHKHSRMTEQILYMNKWIIRHGHELVTYNQPPAEN